MTSDTFFNSINGPNKRLNNRNTFLLDVSAVLINYLIRKNDDFEEKFMNVCVSSPYAGDEADAFLDSMRCITEYVGCKCHDKTLQDFHNEIAQPFRGYCLVLLASVDETAFEQDLLNANSAFFDDYKSVKARLLADDIDLVAAELSLLCWQEALSDVIMQEAMVALRCSYIKKLIF